MSREDCFDIREATGNPKLIEEICESLLCCRTAYEMTHLFSDLAKCSVIAKKLFDCDTVTMQSTQAQYESVMELAVSWLRAYYPNNYRTQHDPNCDFESDVKQGFHCGVGEGEISGTVSLTRYEHDHFPELSMSDGWNKSVHWEFRFCPLCGAKLLPEQIKK